MFGTRQVKRCFPSFGVFLFQRMGALRMIHFRASSPVLGISKGHHGYARPTGLCGPMTIMTASDFRSYLGVLNPQRSASRIQRTDVNVCSFRQSPRTVRYAFFALSIHCPKCNGMIRRLYFTSGSGTHGAPKGLAAEKSERLTPPESS